MIQASARKDIDFCFWKPIKHSIPFLFVGDDLIQSLEPLSNFVAVFRRVQRAPHLRHSLGLPSWMFPASNHALI